MPPWRSGVCKRNWRGFNEVATNGSSLRRTNAWQSHAVDAFTLTVERALHMNNSLARSDSKLLRPGVRAMPFLSASADSCSRGQLKRHTFSPIECVSTPVLNSLNKSCGTVNDGHARPAARNRSMLDSEFCAVKISYHRPQTVSAARNTPWDCWRVPSPSIKPFARLCLPVVWALLLGNPRASNKEHQMRLDI